MKRRAFTLIEVLSAVILLGIFTLLSTRLFITCLKTTTDTQRNQAALFNFDSAVTLLRRDVWGSTTVQLLAPDIVWIGEPDGSSITWRADDPNFLVRSVTGGPSSSDTLRTGQPAKRFPSTIAKLVFRADPQGLALQVTPQVPGVPVQEYHFVSALNAGRNVP